MFPRWELCIHIQWTRRAQGQGIIFPLWEKYHGPLMEREIVVQDIVFYALSVILWAVVHVYSQV